MVALAPFAASAGPMAPISGAQMQGAHVVSWGRVEVDVTLKIAFTVLTDYDRMAQFLPGMLESAVVARDGNAVIIDQSADEGAYLFVQRVDARLAIDESPPDRLTIRALSGSFREFEGSYVLTRKSGRTMVEYRARFLPDFFMPPMIGIQTVQRSLERHLGALAQEMLRRSAGGQVPAEGQAPASKGPDARTIAPARKGEGS